MLDVANLADLAHVSDMLHDWWFSMDEIMPEPRGDTWDMFLAPANRRYRREHTGARTHAQARLLRVREVKSVAIDDPEGIGWYDLHSITFDSRTHSLTFRTNIPVGIDIAVKRLSVAVYSKEDPVGLS